MENIIEKPILNRAKEVEFIDIIGSLIRNAQALETKYQAILHTYKGLDADEYAAMCDTATGYLNRLNNLVDNDLAGKFREMSDTTGV